MTFKRVLLLLLALSFLPELAGVVRWALPVGLGLASSGPVDSLAGSLIRLLLTAWLVLLVLRASASLWRRWSPRLRTRLDRSDRPAE
jgi:hypothetical protein